MRPIVCTSILTLALLVVSGCGSAIPRSDSGRSAPPPPTENQRARLLLCADVGEEACLAACDDSASARDHGECLLALRFGEDPEALRLARALYFDKKTLLGVETRRSIEGYRGQQIEIVPAVPIGSERHHLEWLQATMATFDSFVESIAARADSPVHFDPRPPAVVFFRTSVPSYPSAFCADGVMAYNLDGPLHADRREMLETMFHELFHLSDARRGAWSERTLLPIYEAIRKRCSTDHACFGRYAPHETTVPNGTYYAFDNRTGDVREYAAELALRYYLEHEAILEGRSPSPRAFKCLTSENRAAWGQLVQEFFGGVDLSAECETEGAEES